jgi:OOP family OmpA-OmpF porin
MGSSHLNWNLKMNKFLCSAVFAVTASTMAHADDYYVGASVSPSADGHIDQVENGVTTRHDAASKQRLFGVFAGYRLTPELALEGGYRNAGGDTRFELSHDGQLKAHTSVAYLAARGSWQFSEDWELFGKAGLARSRLALEVTHAGQSEREAVRKYSPYLSIGASWLVTKNVAVQLELEHTANIKYEGLTAKMDKFSLGVRFGF